MRDVNYCADPEQVEIFPGRARGASDAESAGYKIDRHYQPERHRTRLFHARRNTARSKRRWRGRSAGDFRRALFLSRSAGPRDRTVANLRPEWSSKRSAITARSRPLVFRGRQGDRHRMRPQRRGADDSRQDRIRREGNACHAGLDRGRSGAAADIILAQR